MTPLARAEVQKMNYLGTETVGVAIDLAASGGTDATRVSGSIKTVSNDPFNVTQAGTDSDNVGAVKTTTDVKATSELVTSQ